MKSQLAKLLSGIAAIGIATSACGLTIVPTFDGSITNDPNGSAMTNAIYAAIHVFQTKITDSGTVKIHFTNDPSIDLGQSYTWGNYYSYSAYLSALKSRATSINDTNGIGKIPNSSTDPLTTNNQIYMTLALARRMGLDTQYGKDGLDSTISLNMSEMNFSRPPLDSSKYDIAQVAEHEMDEVLGTSSDLYYGSPISPIDLFRYATNLARTYTTSDDNAYFSVDGTNLLARFNMDSGGDYSDWWSINNLWAPPGQTPVSQVQDAFSLPGNALDLGTNELAMLDVIGWTLAVTAQSTTPTLSIVRSGANQFTLSWPNTYSGFVLEERTNLTAGSWAFSTSGSTNPAVIVSATALKFYRLYKPATPAEQPAINTTAALISTNTTLQLHLHVTRPRRPSTD